MRRLTEFKDEKAAMQLCAYLESEKIECEMRSDGSEHVIWVLDEDRLRRASEISVQFRSNPSDPKFQIAVKAERVKSPELAAGKTRAATVANRGIPITITFITISILSTLFMSIPELEHVARKLYFSEFLRPPIPEIRSGEVWRVITPIFLHGGMLHLVFNMLWLYQLGGQIEAFERKFYFTSFVFVMAAVVNCSQFLVSGPSFIGFSGVVYAMLGYIWMMAKYQIGTRYDLHQQTVIFMIVWLLICLSGILGLAIANTQHIVGFVVGTAWGFLRSGGWRAKRRRKDFERKMAGD